MRQYKPSDRDSGILRDVIQAFIKTGEPVSARSVARTERHGLCAASIRNVMADMEERGFLSQPHVSAGRVPTTAGYHYYIDSLMPYRQVSPHDQRYIHEQFEEEVASVDAVLGMATRLLTDLSNQIGILLTPTIGNTTLKALHFVPLSGRRILCVLESVGGLVENKEIETLMPLDRAELIRISNYLTDNFSGSTLRSIRDRLLQMMREERNELDDLIAKAISLAQQALGSNEQPVLLVEGTISVIGQPELSDVARVKKLLEKFTEQAELVQMLNQLLEKPGTCVIIGDDSDLTSDLDFSLVAATYGSSDHPLGTLGIFGPSRMSYQNVVPLVSYLGETVSEALDDT